MSSLFLDCEKWDQKLDFCWFFFSLQNEFTESINSIKYSNFVVIIRFFFANIGFSLRTKKKSMNFEYEGSNISPSRPDLSPIRPTIVSTINWFVAFICSRDGRETIISPIPFVASFSKPKSWSLMSLLTICPFDGISLNMWRATVHCFSLNRLVHIAHCTLLPFVFSRLHNCRSTKTRAIRVTACTIKINVNIHFDCNRFEPVT